MFFVENLHTLDGRNPCITGDFDNNPVNNRTNRINYQPQLYLSAGFLNHQQLSPDPPRHLQDSTTVAETSRFWHRWWLVTLGLPLTLPTGDGCLAAWPKSPRMNLLIWGSLVVASFFFFFFGTIKTTMPTLRVILKNNSHVCSKMPEQSYNNCSIPMKVSFPERREGT